MMRELPARSALWWRFGIMTVVLIALIKAIGYLLWREPLTSHFFAALVGSVAVAWVFSFGPPWRRS